MNSAIKLQYVIGTGNDRIVYFATLEAIADGVQMETKVVLKEVKEKVKYEKECNILWKLQQEKTKSSSSSSQQFIVRFYGKYILEYQQFMILNFMEHGDLLKFLRTTQLLSLKSKLQM